MMFVRLSISLSVTAVHCDHMVHFTAVLSLWLDSAMFCVWVRKLGEALNANDDK